ncbi:hypothetical protein L195_g054204 [Trifolium pratense]|uniref:Uncharacterized protein n=1 Tax=Trifolium pratense TaxID=57577 RepID=A0A2K3JNY5_TRIPR|nr:hypothetical protein L195_g049373 [Trifolium pratense]PNX64798.1 hypothetical protein L195_g054204 [Trifolium pratense]
MEVVWSTVEEEEIEQERGVDGELMMRSEVVWKVEEEGSCSEWPREKDERKLGLEIEGRESENGDVNRRSIFLCSTDTQKHS